MMATQRVDGTGIAYERHGDGQPLISLHGGMAPRQYWSPVLPQFEEYGAAIPQRPRFGTCLDDLGETSPGEVLSREAQYVRTLVDAVDGKPILFDHSYGH
jgi:pimeloyl-ACP methyl ester carboxylesterase